jgi:hypothetical protein
VQSVVLSRHVLIAVSSALALGVAHAQPSPAPAPAPPAPAPTTPPAPAPSAEDKELEAAIASDTAARQQAAPAPPPPSTAATATGALSSFNPDISFILDVAGAVFSTTGPNGEGGDHDPKENGFNLQELEMAIGKTVDPYFRFDGSLVFMLDGVEFEEAYATTLALPHNLQMRVGQFLTRFGRINATHPHTWDFLDQPFAITRLFGGDGNRGLGVEVSYLTPAPFYLELISSATMPRGEETARSFLGAADVPIDVPWKLQALGSVREFFELSDDWSLATGQSYVTGPNPTGPDNRTNIVGVDAYLKYRPITYGSYTIVALQTEWFYRQRDVFRRSFTDFSGYAYVFWRFAQRWGTAARYELGSPPKDQSGHLGDDLDPQWIETRQRISIDATFWPSEFSRIRAQGNVNLPETGGDPIWMAFLALEVVVGAHGAHKF